MRKWKNKMRLKILIKLSGAGMSADSSEPFSNQFLETVIAQLKQLVPNYQIGIVIGGGNIMRGKSCSDYNITEIAGHHLGIMATVINGAFLKAKFDSHKLNSTLLSAVSCPSLATHIVSQTTIDDAFKNHDIVIFAGGTGNPYFSTDTAVALRATQMQADIILIGKNGVDGVYTADPKKDKHAKFLASLTYAEAIKNDLQIMDITAFTMCKENNLKVIIFNINAEHAIIKALSKQGKYTLIEK
ncbi:UMP kinase [Mycoplasmoides pneumoniae]|nr:UMP kinase [Mycoplasmoides pneumoniae]